MEAVAPIRAPWANRKHHGETPQRSKTWKENAGKLNVSGGKQSFRFTMSCINEVCVVITMSCARPDSCIYLNWLIRMPTILQLCLLWLKKILLNSLTQTFNQKCNEFANFFSQKIKTRQNIHATQTNKKTNLCLKPRNNSDIMSQFNSSASEINNLHSGHNTIWLFKNCFYLSRKWSPTNS